MKKSRREYADHDDDRDRGGKRGTPNARPRAASSCGGRSRAAKRLLHPAPDPADNEKVHCADEEADNYSLEKSVSIQKTYGNRRTDRTSAILDDLCRN